jgi:cytochrome c oxidase subunit 2
MSGTAGRRRRPRCVAVAGLLAVLAVVLTGCNVTFGATKGVTQQSHLEFRMWFWMMVAGIVVAVFVWSLIFWAVFRYRRKDDSIPAQTRERIGFELTYTIVPLIMVLIIFAFTVVVENNIDDVLRPPQVIVNVTAYQWGWIFQYSKPGPDQHAVCATSPQDCVTVETAPDAAPSSLPESYTSPLYPQLVLPQNEVVRFFLRSDDVIHGFFVHAFNFSRYAQPGVVNSFEITPSRSGVFDGQCTQYCGLYHSEMLFSVRIESPSEFQAWYSQEALKQNVPASLPGGSS